MQKTTPHSVLSNVPAIDEETGDIRVVIETPKGSRNKYKYNPECDCLELKKVLPEGMAFPNDFGFVPSTVGGDGDPIDVLLLADAPIVAGCIVTARLIGVYEARQKEKGGDWERNDRLVAVATHARSHQELHTLSDFPKEAVADIEAFFEQYNKLSGKKFERIGKHGPGKARELLDAAIAAYKKQRKKNNKSS
jgi:inorganic pyrophosphatase